MQELEIIITPKGEVKIQVIGSQGKECLLITKSLEEALGKVKERNFKTEYYQDAQEQNHLTHQNL